MIRRTKPPVKTPPATQGKGVLPRDPNKALQEMMKIIDALRDVYLRENKALAESDSRAFMALQDEKLSAARQYQMGIEDIMNRAEDMKQAGGGLKIRLQQMQTDFSNILSINAEGLQRMNRVAARLGETIMRAVRESAMKQKTSVYGEHGALRGSRSSRSTSMGVSETA